MKVTATTPRQQPFTTNLVALLIIEAKKKSLGMGFPGGGGIGYSALSNRFCNPRSRHEVQGG